MRERSADPDDQLSLALAVRTIAAAGWAPLWGPGASDLTVRYAGTTEKWQDRLAANFMLGFAVAIDAGGVEAGNADAVAQNQDYVLATTPEGSDR